MVIYFADRNEKIIATASTDLPQGLRLIEDLKSEDLETGVVMFSGKVPYTAETRHICQEGIQVGNLVLVQREGTCEGYTIIETDDDTADGSIYFSAEDAGLELLNEVAIKWPDGRSYEDAPDMTMTEFVNMWIADTGFEIGINDASGDTTMQEPAYDEEVTVVERLLKTAQNFGYEIGYSFEVSTGQMAITHKYVDIYKERGADTGIQLKLNYEINSITTKMVTENLATSLLVYGTNIDDSDDPQTLDGYTVPTDLSEDGDFVIANQYFADRRATKACLQSNTALEKWGRVVNGSLRHLTGVYQGDTNNQAKLCKEAIEELKKRREPEINYEIDISRPIEGVSIGDRVSVIDDNGGLYLTSRVIKYEVSVSEDEAMITLGDHLINDSILQSIPADVRELMDDDTSKPRPPDTFITTLYADGTFIINEPQRKRAANISAHGAITNEYAAWDGVEVTYSFNSASARPWNNKRTSITSVIIGSDIAPQKLSYLFSGMQNCVSMDLTKLDTSNATSMGDMFSGCNSLTALNVSNFKTSNVKFMDSMFAGCQSLGSLDLSSFDTSKVTNMTYMFSNCSASSINLSSFDTSSVTSMYNMFVNCGATSLDLSSFDTSGVTNMYMMFYGCAATSIDLSSFGTSSVTNMENMFGYCSATSLDLSSFDTSSVTTMRRMFDSCKATSIDLSNFDTSSVTDMYEMFISCRATSLDLSSFDTSNITSMENMFEFCSNLTSLDVTSFDTSSVTTMSAMFHNCGELTSLDLSSFDTSSVTDMESMFSNCAKIVTIYASNSFVVTQVTSDYGMFYNCYDLVGGAGTTYSSSNTGKSRAKIDGGQGNRGYFTAG